ncbi:MAG: single-stranded DNA-binding protein [Bacillota bacterium]|nr:single-stranded DNA-binding protein [Bacillota bacterium]
MNQVTLVGRVVQDPELKEIREGVSITRFNLAVDRYLGSAQRNEKKSEGKVTADFPRIVVWGKQAQNCSKFLKKGSLISLQGRVATSMYENAHGDNVFVTEIVGEKVQFLNNLSLQN